MNSQSSLERSRSSRQYTDEEWERVKEPFRYYYIDKNLPLKEAAAKIRAHYNFNATPRQWERRIGADKWNLPKYTNRDERLKAVEMSGRSLHDLGNRGRRKSTGSPDDRLLGDRNMRRWVRRELSRDASRQRSKSVSGASDAVDQEMASAAPSPNPSDYAMDDFSQQQLNDAWISSTHSSQNSPPLVPQIQIHHFREDLQVPQITFSQPDDAAPYLIPGAAAVQDDAAPASHDPPAQRDGDFQAYEDNFHIAQNYDNLPREQGFDWNGTDAFGREQQSNMFTEFHQEATPSFMELLQSAPPNPVETAHDFAGANLGPTEPMQTLIISEGAVPDFDNTYTDVHSLLEDHYLRTSQMVRECVLSCHRSGVNEEVMKRLQLLEASIRAQNVESDRNIRSTLKNIALTQRQATRSIFDLSKVRKRKIDELKAQLDRM